MAVQILSNKPARSAILHINAANTGITIAGNSSVSAIATGSEVLTGCVITKAIWGIDAGSIQIKRNSTTVASFTGTGSVDYASLGMALSANSDQNIVITYTGATNAYVMLEVKKLGALASTY